MGPEMLLSQTFGKLMPTFMKHVATIIVNEAHCISQWGPSFCKEFDQLDKLWSFIPHDLPFLATSATMTPVVLADIQLKMVFSMEKMFLLNLGNNRHNITPLVCAMKGSANDLNTLNFTVDEAINGEELQKTIIYVKSRDTTLKVCEHLRQ